MSIVSNFSQFEDIANNPQAGPKKPSPRNFPLGDLFRLGGGILDVISQQNLNDEARDLIQRGQEEEARRNEERFNLLLDLNDERARTAQSQLNETGQRIAQRRELIRSGVDRAGAIMAGSGRIARRDIADAEQKADAQAQQSATRLGGASTLLPQLYARNRAQSQRDREDVNARLSNQQIGLTLEGTQAEANADRDLTDFMTARTAAEDQIKADRSQIIEGRVDSFDTQTMLSLLQASQAGGSAAGQILGLAGNSPLFGGSGGLSGLGTGIGSLFGPWGAAIGGAADLFGVTDALGDVAGDIFGGVGDFIGGLF